MQRDAQRRSFGVTPLLDGIYPYDTMHILCTSAIFAISARQATVTVDIVGASYQLLCTMDDDYNDDQNLFSCAICGLSDSAASNLTTQNNLQTNATIGCGHQL